MSGRQKWSETLKMGTVPGCVVPLLLVSLLVLSTGSDARRIRKRGLNHKVRVAFFLFFFFLLFATRFYNTCTQLGSHLHQGRFCSRGERPPPGSTWVKHQDAKSHSNVTLLFPKLLHQRASFDFPSG